MNYILNNELDIFDHVNVQQKETRLTNLNINVMMKCLPLSILKNNMINRILKITAERFKIPSFSGGH